MELCCKMLYYQTQAARLLDENKLQGVSRTSKFIIAMPGRNDKKKLSNYWLEGEIC